MLGMLTLVTRQVHYLRNVLTLESSSFTMQLSTPTELELGSSMSAIIVFNSDDRQNEKVLPELDLEDMVTLEDDQVLAVFNCGVSDCENDTDTVSISDLAVVGGLVCRYCYDDMTYVKTVADVRDFFASATA